MNENSELLLLMLLLLLLMFEIDAEYWRDRYRDVHEVAITLWCSTSFFVWQNSIQFNSIQLNSIKFFQNRFLWRHLNELSLSRYMFVSDVSFAYDSFSYNLSTVVIIILKLFDRTLSFYYNTTTLQHASGPWIVIQFDEPTLLGSGLRLFGLISGDY